MVVSDEKAVCSNVGYEVLSGLVLLDLSYSRFDPKGHKTLANGRIWFFLCFATG